MNNKVLRMFTDGACSGNPGPGGYGVIICENEKIKKYSGYEVYTTNNRMELMAVIKALEGYYKDYMNEFDTLEIYSDSAYVVNAITKNWIGGWKRNNWKTSQGKDVKNKDLWLTLSKEIDNLIIVQGKDIAINKVKGHDGNHLNELADEAAVEMSNYAKTQVEKLDDDDNDWDW